MGEIIQMHDRERFAADTILSGLPLRAYEVRGERFYLGGSEIKVITESRGYRARTKTEARAMAEKDFFEIKMVKTK